MGNMGNIFDFKKEICCSACCPLGNSEETKKHLCFEVLPLFPLLPT